MIHFLLFIFFLVKNTFHPVKVRVRVSCASSTVIHQVLLIAAVTVPVNQERQLRTGHQCKSHNGVIVIRVNHGPTLCHHPPRSRQEAKWPNKHS
jgi:hypothetical protein